MGKCSCPKEFFHLNLLKIRDYPREERGGVGGPRDFGGHPAPPFPVWEAHVVRTLFKECVSSLMIEAKSSFLPLSHVRPTS